MLWKVKLRLLAIAWSTWCYGRHLVSVTLGQVAWYQMNMPFVHHFSWVDQEMIMSSQLIIQILSSCNILWESGMGVLSWHIWAMLLTVSGSMVSWCQMRPWSLPLHLCWSRGEWVVPKLWSLGKPIGLLFVLRIPIISLLIALSALKFCLKMMEFGTRLGLWRQKSLSMIPTI